MDAFDLARAGLRRRFAPVLVAFFAACGHLPPLIDTRDALDIAPAAAQIEWPGYVDSWKSAT